MFPKYKAYHCNNCSLDFMFEEIDYTELVPYCNRCKSYDVLENKEMQNQYDNDLRKKIESVFKGKKHSQQREEERNGKV